MQLTYRGVSFRKNSPIATPEKSTLTYRGITFDRVANPSTRIRTTGLIYRGHKYNNELLFSPPIASPAL